MMQTVRKDGIKRVASALLVTMALALPLAACGKKSPPKPPSGDEAPINKQQFPAPE